jgi:antitoxin VapB
LRAFKKTAKLFCYGRSQAVLLPSGFRFKGTEVFIRQDSRTGDVILSRRPGLWGSFFALVDQGGVPDEFMADRGDQKPQKRRFPKSNLLTQIIAKPFRVSGRRTRSTGFPITRDHPITGSPDC